MNAVIETITPERAAQLLKSNTNNYRKLSPEIVKRYADDISAGRWQLNGEAIKISANGILLDGQHRLNAVLRAGRPMQTFVIYGVNADATLYDIGAGRTPSQILNANGFTPSVSSTMTVGAAAIIISGRFLTNRISKPKMLAYMQKNHDHWEPIYSIVSKGSTTPIARKSPVAAAAYCLIRTGTTEEELLEFFGIVNTGFASDFRESSPAIVLRNFLITGAAKTSNKEWRLMAFSVTVSAFYDFRSRAPRKNNYRFAPATMTLFEEVRKLDGVIS